MKPSKIIAVILPVTLIILTIMIQGCASTPEKIRWVNKDNPFTKDIDSFPENKFLDAMDEAGSPEELERLGDLHFSRGNLYMAFVNYEKCLETNPDNNEVRHKKGLLLLSGKLSKDAVTTFEEILKREPDSAPAYEGKGQAFFQMKNYEEAESSFRKAVELDSSLWRAYNFLGVIYDYLHKYDLAIPEYEKALSLNPEEGTIYNNLGVSYSLAGEYEKAVGAYHKALELSGGPKEKIYNNLGVVLSRLERYDEALAAFGESGGDIQAHNNLGCVYLEQGQHKKAVRSFERAMEISPRFDATVIENLRKAKMMSRE